MSDNLDNVLLLALANNELDKFIVGEPFYFQEARCDNDEPQNVVAAFDQLVLYGVAWNSKHGMWDPLMRTAIGVGDKLGGPDFVPSNP